MGNIIVSPPNEAAIISGCRGTRIIIGKCSFQFWVFEKCKRLGLELMTISVQSRSAETAKGVRISLSSTAQIKILTGNGTKVDPTRLSSRRSTSSGTRATRSSTPCIAPWRVTRDR